jgi:hypothetical protein
MFVITSEPTPEISNEIYHRPDSKKTFRRRHLLVPLLAACLTASAGTAQQTVSLAWNPDPDSATAGYVLYSGLASGNYSFRTNVGMNTKTTIGGLTAGSTNYFAVTAYNSAGVEGPPSGEISYLVPGSIHLTGQSKSGKNGATVNMQFSVAAGHWYQIQASTDLKNWTVIGQTSTNSSNAWVSFQDAQSPPMPSRFYRLVMH